MEYSCLLLTSQSLPPLTLCVCLLSTLSPNLRTGTTQTFFYPPEWRAHTVTKLIVGWRHRRHSAEIFWCYCREDKAAKEVARFPSSLHIHKSRLQYCRCLGFGSPSPTVFPVRLVPWDWNNKITGEVPTFPGSTGHFLSPQEDLKSQRSVRELKENLRFSATYWKTIETFIINVVEKCHS